MAKIIVNEREYEVRDGQNMLQAALSVGLDLPYFCWHPAMGSIGACRQCVTHPRTHVPDAAVEHRVYRHLGLEVHELLRAA